MSDKIGRRPDTVDDPSVHDAPESTVEKMLTKMDQMIDLNKSLMAKLDADTGVTDTDYAVSLSTSLKKLDLIL